MAKLARKVRVHPVDEGQGGKALEPGTRGGRVLRSLWIVVVLSSLLHAGCGRASAAAREDSGTGWNINHLHLEVALSRDPASMSMRGRLEAQLEDASSRGPTFRINDNGSQVRWVSLETHTEAVTTLNDQVGGATFAHVRSPTLFERGATLELEFELALEGGASQILARNDIAFASWVHAWYPHVRQTGDQVTARAMSIPGTTTLHLPPGWLSLADGRLLSRKEGPEETVEIWDTTDQPVARSFTAGPYTALEQKTGNKWLRVYLLGDHPLGGDRLAELLSRTMSALEAKLGPFPFSGYGVAELPNDLAGWKAASLQTFILAKADAFRYAHGNLPLWAHELAHGWWGNTVETKGPGSKMTGEALAQVGALIALEALEGREAMLGFLEHSRSGYSASQCARGYFSLVDQQLDHPLSSLGRSGLSGALTHSLADSKGMWVYHMLRQRVGDEIFFGTLRSLITTFSGKALGLEELRQAFVDAAPDHELEAFFAQWLDRTGAVDLEASISNSGDSSELVLTQPADRPPFLLDLEVDLHLEDGTVRREQVSLLGYETSASFTLSSPLASVELDPNREVLLRRPSYDAMPEVEGIAERAEWMVPEVYVGHYSAADGAYPFDIDATGPELWIRIPGESLRLWPSTTLPHRFWTAHGWGTFQVENGRSVGVQIVIQDGPTIEATRRR